MKAMSEVFRLGGENLLSPPILFFLLGMLAAWLKSDLELPGGFGKALAIYLMVAIGFKGGVELHARGVSLSMAGPLAAAVALSFLLPFLAFFLLRRLTRTGIVDSAAIAAHYGSTSVVTFVTAVSFLQLRGEDFEGYLIVMLALMETPAIVSGLLLARRSTRIPTGNGLHRLSLAEWMRILTGGSILLLVGSFLIGLFTGRPGLDALAGLLEHPFKGVLCLFLLEMGLLAGSRLGDFRQAGWLLLLFGVYMPLLGGAVGLLGGYIFQLSPGGGPSLPFSVPAPPISWFRPPCA